MVLVYLRFPFVLATGAPARPPTTLATSRPGPPPLLPTPSGGVVLVYIAAIATGMVALSLIASRGRGTCAALLLGLVLYSDTLSCLLE